MDERAGMDKTPRMQLMEYQRGRKLEELIPEQIEEGMSLSQIADQLGISRLTLRDWFTRLGIRAETRRVLVINGEPRQRETALR